MAHKKAGGSKARQGGKAIGKRLGFKIYGGESAKTGQIILRQRGTRFHPGVGSSLGRDQTIFAAKDGVISVRTKLGRKYIDIVENNDPKKG
ncbi:MAG: 50S ribosomal protein L27 [Candidatus Woykebacteria bacterium RBG_16_39_9b]|uniref:Large ribosomal subunit protein bL27 n=1 Tax=Candidatus Woykebacteria bacterium RBG_16_39_9b TaxID=1802595 RepID=A0A1G1WBM0_9BACT|nr:MAG: 50S ribosomal protein L27 [Candidatus Woykebacteria bacterium RBG_16_39_9b]